MHTESMLQLAVKHHRAGELGQAEQLYRQLLATDTDNVQVMHNLGTLLVVKGSHAEGLQFLNTALKLEPGNSLFWSSLAEGYLVAGRTDETDQVAREGLLRGFAPSELTQIQLQARQRSPSSAVRESVAELFAKGLLPDVLAAARDLIAKYPAHFYGWQVLATVFHAQGQFSEALEAILEARRRSPENSSVLNTLGVLQKLTGQLDAAEASFLSAIAVSPQSDKAHSNLGAIYLDTGRLAMAEAAFRLACQLAPNSAEAHNNLGVALRDLRRLQEAEQAFSRALQLNPSYSDAWCNYGVSLRESGKLVDCVAAYNKALQLRPQNLTAFSNLLFAQNFSQAWTATEALNQARRYGAIASSTAAKRFEHGTRPSRPMLRLGFVSGDLREHVVSYFLEGVLANLDHRRFQLYAYPTTALVDTVTARLKSCFSQWRPIYGMSDAEAAQLIHDDGIDILFDLSGHTAYNRLPVFAHKPAPVQISWLGYFATTGLAEMDYVLADPVSVPEDHHRHFAEKILTLPSTRLLFTPPAISPAVAPLPAIHNGHVTFGCFQNFTKLQDPVLKLWARVMERVPQARLCLQCRQFADPANCELACLRLRMAGIDLDRVSVRPPTSRLQYLEMHSEIDIILDTFPFPGGTTTCEALWMGVPTLTMCGERMISRQGASLLTAAGLRDWIAENDVDFIQRAIDFARDVDSLALLRRTLRARVSVSSLCDATTFGEDFAECLESAWQH